MTHLLLQILSSVLSQGLSRCCYWYTARPVPLQYHLQGPPHSSLFWHPLSLSPGDPFTIHHLCLVYVPILENINANNLISICPSVSPRSWGIDFSFFLSWLYCSPCSHSTRQISNYFFLSCFLSFVILESSLLPWLTLSLFQGHRLSSIHWTNFYLLSIKY